MNLQLISSLKEGLHAYRGSSRGLNEFEKVITQWNHLLEQTHKIFLQYDMETEQVKMDSKVGEEIIFQQWKIYGQKT